MCTQSQIIAAHIAREQAMEQYTVTNETLGEYFARLDSLRAKSHASENAATAIISAARDGMIAAYQAELNLDVAYCAVSEMARAMLANAEAAR